MRHEAVKSIQFDGRQINCRLIHSDTAKKLRVRVGLGGVEIVQPVERSPLELDRFLEARQE